MNRKKVVLLVLSLIVVLSIALIIYFALSSKKLDKKDNNTYYCETIIKDSATKDYNDIISGFIISYSVSGSNEVTGIKNVTKMKYKSKDVYDSTVNFIAQDGFEYVRDDKNLVVELREKEFKKDGIEQNSTPAKNINSYIEFLKSSGYTCTKNN